MPVVTQTETFTALSARRVAETIAHTFRIHGIDSREDALSRDGLPSLQVWIDGRVFLVTVEEQP